MQESRTDVDGNSWHPPWPSSVQSLHRQGNNDAFTDRVCQSMSSLSLSVNKGKARPLLSDS